MIRRFLTTAAVGLLFTAGAAFAQNQTCPRTDCPRQGQCLRQGRGAMRGPAANMNRGGMRRGRGMAMQRNCPAPNPPAPQSNSTAK